MKKTQSPLHEYVNVHNKQILSIRESLFCDLIDTNKKLGKSIKILFQKKWKESGCAPLWGDIIPCVYRDILGLDSSYEEIFKEWFALYIQMIVLDDVTDKNHKISTEVIYQSVLLQLKGLDRLLIRVARSKQQKIFDDMTISAFNGQLQEIALKNNTKSIQEKQAIAIEKNHLNHLLAIVIAHTLPQHEAFIMKLSSLMICIENAFDDIQDIQEDFDEKNYSPLILRILGDKAKTFTGNIFEECIRSGVLETELKRCKSYIGKIMLTLKSGGLENIQKTSSRNMFKQMQNDTESVLESLRSFDLNKIQKNEMTKIKALIQRVIPI